MPHNNISIASDFSLYPGLRHCNISDNSGEEFYHKILNGKFYQAIINKVKLTISLDATDGYASSFLDEAFGNLVYDFTEAVVKNNLEIVSLQEPHWKNMLEQETFDQWETRRKQSKSPIVTKEHKPWYRSKNGLYEFKVWERPTQHQI